MNGQLGGNEVEATLQVVRDADGALAFDAQLKDSPPPAFKPQAISLGILGKLRFDWKVLLRAFLAPVATAILDDRVVPIIAERIKEEQTKQELIQMIRQGGADALVSRVAHELVDLALDEGLGQS